MQPVYKCEYCNYMDTEDKVKEHEVACFENYDRRSCFTCKHQSLKSVKQYQCACGKEIPEGKIFEFCGQYEREEKSENPLGNIFGNLFGGI